MIRNALASIMIALLPTMAHAETVNIYAAGSLKAALTEIARAFEAQSNGAHTVATEFAASGLLRDRIEKGEPAHVFASANMEHPRSLASRGLASGTVALFARNQLCALARSGLAVTTDTLLDVMLAAGTRLGTSTPKADPAGDYAYAMFEMAEKLRPGARATLEAKAQQLTGGPTSPKAPDGRNLYAWVMDTDKADVFLTYCTNAVLARKQLPDLKIVEVPRSLAVGADYGMIVLKDAPAAASALAAFIGGATGQAILAKYGFGRGDSAN
ncbi:MAG: molybdate ABC transporter substrate-binding protein [Pseudomonadota bacterium]